jgi:predicted DNA-binding transcriptional regulator AlpA
MSEIEALTTPAGVIIGYGKLAKYLGVKEQTARNNRGYGIPSVGRLGRERAWRKVDVDKWLAEQAGEKETPADMGDPAGAGVRS